MQDYNEDIKELIQITKLLHREVKRLNTKIRTERLSRILNSIPQKTILYSGKQLNNIDNNIKIDSEEKIIVRFE